MNPAMRNKPGRCLCGEVSSPESFLCPECIDRMDRLSSAVEDLGLILRDCLTDPGFIATSTVEERAKLASALQRVPPE